jgi:hypothetical protein
MGKPKATRVPVNGRLSLKALALVVCLIAAIALVYGQTLGLSFINYDDDSYISANGIVRAGLTAQGVRYAFTGSDRFYCHFAERKDVLSGALTFAVLCLYTRYVETGSARNYVALLG